MGVGYQLVNLTKQETITFANLPAAKAREIAGNPAAAAVVAWYLLQNTGDRISFVGDDGTLPGGDASWSADDGFSDRTAAVVEQLLEAGILVDCGVGGRDPDQPELFTRDLRNAWMPRDMLCPPDVLPS